MGLTLTCMHREGVASSPMACSNRGVGSSNNREMGRYSSKEVGSSSNREVGISSNREEACNREVGSTSNREDMGWDTAWVHRALTRCPPGLA